MADSADRTTDTQAGTADPLAATLAGGSKAEQAATEGPWSVSQRHGVDIADEAWSEVKITAPGGDIAATFISHVLENYHDGDDADFIITARTAMPRLLKAIEDALKEHQPVNRGEDLEPICGTCHRGFWPCPTYRAITVALAGEEAGDGG